MNRWEIQKGRNELVCVCGGGGGGGELLVSRL